MYAALSGPAGNQPFNDWFTPDTTQRFALGTKSDAVDPYWGWGEFVYGKANGAIAARLLCVFDETFQAVGMPNAANQGFPACVAMSKMATLTFGWFMVAGLTPIVATATVAADASIGLTGVGTVGAFAAGKQIVNVRNRLAQTATKTFANTQTTNNSGALVTNGYDGLFLGAALSGTGVPASTVVAGLSPDGRTVLMGSAIGTFDKVATATGSITLTGTWTGYTVCQIAYPFAQGQIT
jgi:hypothetical protein